MGREIKRVPARFNYPLGKTWDGFLNPHKDALKKCTACDGSTLSPEAKHLQDQWYGNAPFKPEDRGSKPFSSASGPVYERARRNLKNAPEYYGRDEQALCAEAERLAGLFNSQWCHHLNATDVAVLLNKNRLMDLTHTWKQGEGWKPKVPAVVPTPEEVNVWSLQGFGHDSLNSWYCVGAECERLGFPYECQTCKGEGNLWTSDEARARYEGWTETPIPEGDWWQVWETVSEGSPVTPAFATAEELIDYLCANGDKWDQDRRARGTSLIECSPWKRSEAEAFVKAGWAISMVASSETGVMTGVQALGLQHEQEAATT